MSCQCNTIERNDGANIALVRTYAGEWIGDTGNSACNKPAVLIGIWRQWYYYSPDESPVTTFVYACQEHAEYWSLHTCRELPRNPYFDSIALIKAALGGN